MRRVVVVSLHVHTDDVRVLAVLRVHRRRRRLYLRLGFRDRRT